MSGSAPPGPPRSNCRRSRSLASIRRLLVLILVVAGLGVAGWALTPAVDDLDARVRAVQPAATYTPIAAIPRRLQVATVAIEDERFFQHHGVDSQGVVRALWNNLRSGHLNEGASTITQQLAKRTYLQGDDRSWRRKADEVILAVKMERQYGKAQILEYYLNDIYYGRGAISVSPRSS